MGPMIPEWGVQGSNEKPLEDRTFILESHAPELNPGAIAYFVMPSYLGFPEDLDVIHDFAVQRYGLSNFRVVVIHNGTEREEREFDSAVSSGKRRIMVNAALHISGTLRPDGYLDKHRITAALNAALSSDDIVYLGGHGNPKDVHNNMLIATPSIVDLLSEIDAPFSEDAFLKSHDISSGKVYPLNCSANGRFGCFVNRGGKPDPFFGISYHDFTLMIAKICSAGPDAVFDVIAGKRFVKPEYIPHHLDVVHTIPSCGLFQGKNE